MEEKYIYEYITIIRRFVANADIVPRRMLQSVDEEILDCIGSIQLRLTNFDNGMGIYNWCPLWVDISMCPVPFFRCQSNFEYLEWPCSSVGADT